MKATTKGSVTQTYNIQDPEAREAFKSIEGAIDSRKRSFITSDKKQMSKSEVLKLIEEDQIMRDANGQVYFRKGNQIFYIDPGVIIELK